MAHVHGVAVRTLFSSHMIAPFMAKRYVLESFSSITDYKSVGYDIGKIRNFLPRHLQILIGKFVRPTLSLIYPSSFHREPQNFCHHYQYMARPKANNEPCQESVRSICSGWLRMTQETLFPKSTKPNAYRLRAEVLQRSSSIDRQKKLRPASWSGSSSFPGSMFMNMMEASVVLAMPMICSLIAGAWIIKLMVTVQLQ